MLPPLLAPVLLLLAADFPRFEAKEIDHHAGEVIYAVAIADVDGDKKPDVVAATEDAILWYANPSWQKHVIIQGKTARDNVCIQPHDIDGDGRVDFALGAGWKPPDTITPGTLQWLGRDARGEWQIHPITYAEPSLHRLRWGDVLGTGKPQLIVAPLQGRGTKGPNWGDGNAAKIRVFTVPDDPTNPDWPGEVAEDSLHTTHNFQVGDVDGDHRQDLLVAAWEGVFQLSRLADGTWTKQKLGNGFQPESGNKGASEIKLGRMADGRAIIATIEPWHGDQVVIYHRPGVGEKAWNRRPIGMNIPWGHALGFADLDGDGDQELIVGQRDPSRVRDGVRIGPGVWVYDADERSSVGWARQTIDDGGMACEDAVAADLDGDGRAEIIAGGRATHNLKIYWNKGTFPPR